MIDIHTHILPGIDDGSSSLKESLEMCRAAYDDGIRTIVATPHYKPGVLENSRNRILKAVDELQKELMKQKISVEILPGCEALAFPELPELIEKKELLTINDTGRYLLIELPPHGVDMESIKNLIFRLGVMDIIPIIAHPERYVFIQKDPELMTGLVNQGALSQISARYLLSNDGAPAAKTAHYLIKRGLVHIIASDAHNFGERKSLLKDAFTALEGLISPKLFTKITRENPRAVLNGGTIDTGHVETLEELNPKKPVLKKIFGFLIKE